ncbi:MAG: MBL fold metallo-hydrolase [Nitrososphaerota archaeon]|nr:MBL fold metallo-hydrolase [Candidatus Calditenuaceae archaeon]MDW8072959.1 MBL fold metallo-hydrolase [Nitrososphaerota archaeon]
MRITILGSGSIVPSAFRFGSGVHVRAGEVEMLLDCGPGVLEKMRRLSLSPFNLSAVCITHFHVDHVTDLLPLLKLRAFTPEGLPNLEPKPIRILGPKGTKRLLKTLIDENEFFTYLATLMKYESYSQSEDVEPWKTYDIGGASLTSAPVTHGGGIAYRLEYQGASIAFSGDTAFDENMAKLAKGVDVLIHECSFPSEKLAGQHVSEIELARIVELARPKTVVVTHLYPVWESQEHRIVEALEGRHRCRVIIANDCLELSL